MDGRLGRGGEESDWEGLGDGWVCGREWIGVGKWDRRKEEREREREREREK